MTKQFCYHHQHVKFKIGAITLQTKVHLVKAMVFLVVMYGCESWTVKKAEHWRIDAFELWCWRRLLRVPWTAGRSNQSILKEISPGISLEGMMLKLKLQYFGHVVRRVDSLEKTLMLGGIGAGGEGDDRGWDGWMASLTRGRESEWTPGVGDGQMNQGKNYALKPYTGYPTTAGTVLETIENYLFFFFNYNYI